MTNKKTVLVLVLVCLMAGTLVAREAKTMQEANITQEAKVTPKAKVTQLLSKDLPNLPGKEGLMALVEYPPGSSDPTHRHNAHGFIYVPRNNCTTSDPVRPRNCRPHFWEVLARPSRYRATTCCTERRNSPWLIPILPIRPPSGAVH
jgi:hypothetical protein